MDYALGIDLGTTYSCVGVYRNNKIEIIPNSISRTLPSYVCFKEKKTLIGFSAKEQRTKNYENTIYDIKRLIGRNFSDKIVQEDMKLWPFKIDAGDKDKPKIIIKLKDEIKEYYPEQISSYILKELKKISEAYLGKKVKNAVITVPAYFNNSQRQSTIDAGRIAGLNVIRTINEPTAAAIAYGLENKSNKERKVCVFDFGGGTLDVSILFIHNDNFKVMNCGGDSHLGGEDIDNELVKFCIDKFKEEHNIDISNDLKALRRLKIYCEKTKEQLSVADEANIEIENLSENEDLKITILRTEFENLCIRIFERCINLLKETIENSSYSKNEIDEVILIGGSSRIPKIQEMIKAFFNNKEFIINKNINPDEAIAYGASIIAAKEKGLTNLIHLEIQEICPLSLGIEVIGNIMSFIIKRKTPLPCKKTKIFTTTQDFQTKFGIAVYQGERKFVQDNFFLDKFILNDITKDKKGKIEMIVTFEIDNKFSVLKVSAEEKGTNNKKEINITRLQRDETIIEKMIEEEEEEKFNNNIKKKKNKIKGDNISCCYLF